MFENDEMPGVRISDVQEVSNYVAAMNHGLRRLRRDFPRSRSGSSQRSTKYFCRAGVGVKSSPANFELVKTGSAARVLRMPPSHRRRPTWLPDCMGKLELFFHEERPDLPLLIKAGLVHVQFETIHPFLDGNGRLGRLLIIFLLCAQDVIRDRFFT